MPCTISLLWVMSLLIAVVTITTALISFIPPYLAGLKAIDSSMEDLRKAYVVQMSHEVEAFFAAPVSLAESFQMSSKGGTMRPLEDGTEWDWILSLAKVLNQSKGVTQFNAFSLATSYPGTGNLRMVVDQRGGNVKVLFNNATSWLWYMFNDDGTVNWSSQKIFAASFTKPRPLPSSDLEWYQGPLQGFSTAQLELQYMLRNPAGVATAMIGVVILPTEINDFFKTFNLRPRSRAMCFDVRTGTVMGISWAENLTVANESISAFSPLYWERLKLLTLENVTDPMTSTVIRSIGESVLRFLPIPSYAGQSSSEPKILSYTLGSGAERTTVDVIEVSGPQLKVRVLLAISVIDFQGEIVKTQTRTVAGVVGAVVAMMLIALIIAHLMVQPFKQLEYRMYLSATLQDDGEEESRSHLSEVAGMQDSYMRMRAELAKMKSYLPQSVLCQLYDTGSAGEVEDEITEGSVLVASANNDSSAGASFRTTTVSDKASTRRGTVASSTEAGKEKKEKYLNTNVGASLKKVSVLMINVMGFHKEVRLQGIEKLTSLQADMLNMVESVVSRQKGVIDFFQGDHVAVSFNAATYAALHTHKAASAALALLQAFKANPHLEHCTIGLSSGSAFVGNMGSAGLKRFCIVGAVVPQAAALERLAKLYAEQGVSVLIHSGNFSELVEFEYQPVGIFPLPGSPQGRIVAALERQKQFAMDEWMYQLQGPDGEQGSAGHPFDAMNGAFEDLVNGNYEGAKAKCNMAKVRMAVFDGQKNARKSLSCPTVLGMQEAERIIDTRSPFSLGPYYEKCVC